MSNLFEATFYLRQRPNAFPVVPVSTLSAPIASSNIVRGQVPTVADPAGEQVKYPTITIEFYNFKNKEQILGHL